jgi:ATP-binding cassette subfamily F protein 3
MAKMLVSPSNMLLLDEPTNHLDLRAKDVLLDAIRNFTGTVLFVSHDRYFIDGLATRVFEVEDRRLHIYPGNYEDYLWRKQGGPQKTAASLATSLKPAASSNSAHPSNFVILSEVPELGEEPALSLSKGTQSKDPEEAVVAQTLNSVQPQIPIKRLNPIKLKQLEDRLQHAEQNISRLESAITVAEERLGNFSSAEQSQKDAAELETLRNQRTAALTEWEELSLTLEEQQLA